MKLILSSGDPFQGFLDTKHLEMVYQSTQLVQFWDHAAPSRFQKLVLPLRGTVRDCVLFFYCFRSQFFKKWNVFI